jgi:hypothetical protein
MQKSNKSNKVTKVTGVLRLLLLLLFTGGEFQGEIRELFQGEFREFFRELPFFVVGVAYTAPPP